LIDVYFIMQCCNVYF